MVLLGSMLCKEAVMTVRAETASAFSIEAEVLRSDNETYDVRLTVENQGGDWEGTVRLMMDDNYLVPCAYDTALSLPQGSRKQFVVKVPANSVDRTTGTVRVTLLDIGDKVVAEKRFERLLTAQIDALSMGILSDSYSELTYLDMGGREINFYYNNYPIKLVELQQGSLEDELDALTFLVIDQYNTGILTAEELDAIELWNFNGGVLLLGTGAYAEDTLGGFDGGYQGISYSEIHAPGDEYAYDYPGSVYTEMDMSQLTMAELQESSVGYGYSYYSFDADYFYRGLFAPVGNGSLCVLPYSLTELGRMDKSFWSTVEQEDFVQGLINNASNYAGSRYSTSSYYYDDYNYYIQRLLRAIGNSNSVLNFGMLKLIVVMYVIFVGPVLYLVLRLLKRRELYWIAVPVTAFLGIGLVFLAGRGFEVVDTRVYSVTMKNPSGNENSTSYLYCYDAARREWDLRLAEGCDYVGPFEDTYYYSVLGDKPYFYHVKKEGDTFSLGINPDSNFDDSYFYLSSTGNDSGAEGSLLMQNMSADINGLHGTIVNDTNKDIAYFAVIVDYSLFVYRGLSAGASCSLQDADLLYTTSDNYYSYSWYLYDFLEDYYYDGEYGEVSTLAALGIGIFDIYSHQYDGEFVVIGVVENWDKTVDDDCSEISYGCLYSVQ